jgi:subtilisin-like proprotein convertase family protein
MKGFMKKQILFFTLTMGMMLQATAGLSYSYQGLGYSIPDGNDSGVFSTIVVNGANLSLSDITVTLNVSDGYNGDLYAYLSYNGTLVTLLNRIGVGTSGGNGGTASGNSDAGFTIILGSSGTDVHTAANGALAANGSYLADGRNIDPSSSPVSFDAAGTQNLNGSYGGMDPNGTWTLFFADVSGGGGTSTVNGWSLDITAVPEPVNVALAIFGVALLGTGVARWCSSSTAAASRTRTTDISIHG